MNELCPFSLSVRGVNKLDLNGSPGNDILSSRQEVSADDRLEDAALSRALSSNNHNLGKVKIEWHFGSIKDLL